MLSQIKYHRISWQDWSTNRQIHQLYLTAFPAVERSPYLSLQFQVLIGKIQCVAYYDQDTFIGFTYLTTVGDTVYLLYFAVAPNLRGQGYGTQILAKVQELAAGRNLALDIEIVDRHADNFTQRLSRRNFYLRNGFQGGQYRFSISGERYELLTTNEDWTWSECDYLVQRLWPDQAFGENGAR